MTKESSEYHRTKKSKDGIISVCKACKKLEHLEKYPLNKDKYKISSSNWRKKNAEKFKVKKKEWHTINRERCTEVSRNWRRKNADRVRSNYLLKKYGITPSDYDALLAAQDGACAMCKSKPENFDLDHDHKTGVVRGILCGPCNRAIGLLRDSPDLFLAGHDYLLRSTVKKAA